MTRSDEEFDDAAQGRKIFQSFKPREVRPRVSTMLRDLFGRGRDGKRPDTAASAEGLGVSQRTVQRWLKDGPPKNSHGIDELRERWQDSPSGRRRRIDAAVRRKLSQRQAIGCKFYGYINVSSDYRNEKPRTVNFTINKPQAERLLEAMKQGDDEATYQAWMDGASEPFGGSVDFRIGTMEWDE